MRYKAYIYPVTNRLKTGITNPYLDNFIESSESYISFLNKKHPSDFGIFNLLRFLPDINILFLNWAENLPEKKGGFFQSIFLLLLLRLKRLLRIKVVWTMHNKISHSNENFILKKYLFRNLLRYSDLVITHSQEGVRFAEELIPGSQFKFFYFPHPVTPVNGLKESYKNQYDILIWGTLAPYKGIDTFLEFLKKNNSLNRYRILIAGKAISQEFYERIKMYADENITINDQFVDPERLTRMIRQSKVVLFTYAGNSVLSSGALMDSISHRAFVIGPSVGAFAEMGSMGIIKTYNDFAELLKILDEHQQQDVSITHEKMTRFIYSHTWAEFSKSLKKQVEGLVREKRSKWILLRSN